MDAKITVRAAAAEAIGTEIDLDVEVDGTGEPLVIIKMRESDPDCTGNGRMHLLFFTPQDWQRLKRSIEKVDQAIEELRSRGLVFETLGGE
jgi:hypothetical protein